MGALPQALPLALAASLYPPALLVLLLLMTGPRPFALVLAYYEGAALVTVGSGVIALAVLDGAGATASDSETASGGVYIVLGVLLLLVAAWAWRRRSAPPKPAAPEPSDGRIAQWSRRATASRRWAFVLGGAMYLPSPMYLLAVKTISDDSGTSAGALLAVLICALTVLLFVEVPLVALLIRPDGVAPALQRVHSWLGRNAWGIAAVLALAAGVYAIVKGLAALT